MAAAERCLRSVVGCLIIIIWTLRTVGEARPTAGSAARSRQNGRGVQRRHRQHGRRQGRPSRAGAKAVAVTADSPSVPRAEIADARRLAEQIGIRHLVVATDEFADPDYVRNDGSRCYFCKSELYGRIETLLAGAGRGRDLQRRQPRRPGRLPARAQGGRGTRRPPSVAGGGLHQGRRARPGPGVGPADLGQAGVAVPVEPAGPRRGGDAGAHRPASRRPRSICTASACANAGCGCTKANWPASKCRRRNWPVSPRRRCATVWCGG